MAKKLPPSPATAMRTAQRDATGPERSGAFATGEDLSTRSRAALPLPGNCGFALRIRTGPAE